jgi:hypothetical protein
MILWIMAAIVGVALFLTSHAPRSAAPDYFDNGG